MANVTISSIEDLIAFSNGTYGRGTSGDYLNVTLTADLDFSQYSEELYSWAGCTGTWYCYFDGQGHTIDNIYSSVTGQWGFFNTLYGGIKNLKLTNLYVIAVSGHAAAFVYNLCDATSYIKNCHVSGQVETIGAYAGGLCVTGTNNPKIEECSFSGTVKASGGGCPANALAMMGGYAYIKNCIFVGDVISASQNAGCWGARTTYINCEFRGTVQCPNGAIYTGGDNGNIINCIIILKTGTTGAGYYIGGYYANSYYDSDEAEAAGITANLGAAPATTAELKSASWLRSKGFAI